MDTIMTIIMTTPQEMSTNIAKCAKAKRLALNFSQKTLSMKSNVSLSVIKKFERTGKISLESLLKLSLALGALEDFNCLFKPKEPEDYISLDDLLKDKTRKRGRT
jgi:transcriptional regulator with XRE-family HTH domain